MQARLDQEAEEYAKLMAQHARSGGAAAGGDGKKKKKKKQKKDSESTPATSAAPAADPIPESMEAVFDSGAAVDQWTSCHSDNAPAGDDWCAAPSGVSVLLRCGDTTWVRWRYGVLVCGMRAGGGCGCMHVSAQYRAACSCEAVGDWQP